MLTTGLLRIELALEEYQLYSDGWRKVLKIFLIFIALCLQKNKILKEATENL